MLECLRFIFATIVQFMRMLFTIDIGNNMSLGLIMCIVFIFLPMMLRVINFLKMYSTEVIADELSTPSSKKGGKKK